MATTKVHIGDRYTHWTVMERAENRGGASYWVCRCDCGNTGVIRGKALTQDRSRSCGCGDGIKRKPVKRVRRAFHELLEAVNNAGFKVCECGKLTLDVDLKQLLSLAKPPTRNTSKRYFGIIKVKNMDELEGHGGDRRSEKANQVEKQATQSSNNDALYKTRRIKRDAPTPTHTRKSHLPGNIYRGLILLENNYPKWTLQCQKCGATIMRYASNVIKNQAICDCQSQQIHAGERVNNWIVKEKHGQKWVVECSKCGRQITRTDFYIKKGKTKCSCDVDYDPRGRKIDDPIVVKKHLESGTRFNRLFVRDYLGVNAQGEQLYNCSCLCGGETIATRNDLENGATTHCGCMNT